MIPLENYPYTDAQIQERIAEYTRKGNPYMDEQQAYRFILNCIDLTTLEGSDNRAVVEALCQRAIDFRDDARNLKSTAAVCVYPPFAAIAKEQLKGTDIHVACVAGAFPAGQSPIEVKLAEVRYALEQGADEIDMVISRGKFLEGNYQEVYDEIKAIREACTGARLKVILETGELKTSTGKIAVNATPESFLVMLDAIKQHYEKTGEMVSIKPAGGISDPDTALNFVSILANVLGDKWMNNGRFRIGASRLANKIFDKIQ